MRPPKSAMTRSSVPDRSGAAASSICGDTQCRVRRRAALPLPPSAACPGASLVDSAPHTPASHPCDMGQYLSAPNTDQESVSGAHERLGAYGVVSMQGWRKSQVRKGEGERQGPAGWEAAAAAQLRPCRRPHRAAVGLGIAWQAAPGPTTPPRARTAAPRRPQEDAHIAEHISDDCHLFGVFDGHGGHEVARFCSRRMPAELKRQPAFQSGRYEESLKQVGPGGPRSGVQARLTAAAATAAHPLLRVQRPPLCAAASCLVHASPADRCSTAWTS